MFAKYGYILPLIVLLLYTEYKKRKFLKEANKTDVDVRNINLKSIHLKSYLYYFFVLLFSVLYDSAVVTIRENVDPKYIGVFISIILPLFILLSIFFYRTNKDFYVKENCIYFPYKPEIEIPNDHYFQEISNGQSYTAVRLVDNTGGTKVKNIAKLYVYNDIYKQEHTFF